MDGLYPLRSKVHKEKICTFDLEYEKDKLITIDDMNMIVNEEYACGLHFFHNVLKAKEYEI